MSRISFAPLDLPPPSRPDGFIESNEHEFYGKKVDSLVRMVFSEPNDYEFAVFHRKVTIHFFSRNSVLISLRADICTSGGEVN